MDADIISISSSSSSISSSSNASPTSVEFELTYGFPPDELVAILARHMDNQGRSLPRLFLDHEGVIALGREGYEIEAWQLWDLGMKLGGWEQITNPITASLLALRLSLPPKLARSIRLPPLPARPAPETYHPGPRSPEFPSRADETRVILQAVWYHYFAAFEVVQMIRVGMGETWRERERAEEWRRGVREEWREMVLARMASRHAGDELEMGASDEQVEDDEEEEEEEDVVGNRTSPVDPPIQPVPYPTPPSESGSLPECASLHQRISAKPPSPPPTVLRGPNQLAQSALSSPSPLGRARGTLIPLGNTAYEVLQTPPPSESRLPRLEAVPEEPGAPTRRSTLLDNERQLLFSRPDQLVGPFSGQHISRPSFRIGANSNVKPPDRTSTTPRVSTAAAATRKRPLDDGLLAPSKRQHCSSDPIGDCPISRIDSPATPLAGCTVVLGSDIIGDDTRLKLEVEIASLGGVVGTRRTREDWHTGSKSGREVVLICWMRKGEEVSRAIGTGAKLHTPLWLSTFKHPNLTASLPEAAFRPRATPSRGFESLKISLTSYLPPLKPLLINLITSTGASYSPNLTKSCTHLLCPAAVDEAGTQKLQQAEKAGIKVIRDGRGWLERAIEADGKGKDDGDEEMWEADFGEALKGLSITEI